jgi:hypothetical protein
MLSLQDSAVYTRDLFKRLWGQQGGLFHGDVMSGQTPQSLSPLKIYQSPPLADIIRGINKFSNNIAARQLYLTLGIGDVVINNSPATLSNPRWRSANGWRANNSTFRNWSWKTAPGYRVRNRSARGTWGNCCWPRLTVR